MAQVLIAHPTLVSYGHCVARILTRIKLSSTMSPKKWLSTPNLFPGTMEMKQSRDRQHETGDWSSSRLARALKEH